MAKFKIDAVNYCAAGKQGKFINVDYSILSPEGEVEKQVKNATFVTDYRKDNELFFDGGEDTELADTSNEFGFNIVGTKNIVHPLFDFKDLRIQSNTGSRMKKNYGIDSETKTGKTTLEIYSPHLVKDPLEYTQLDDYVYCLTDKTNVGPVFKKSDIYLQKRMLSAEQSTTVNPVYSYYLNPYDSDRLKYLIDGINAPHETIENHIPIYSYPPLWDLRLSGEEYYSDLCATPVSSYYQYLGSFGDDTAHYLSTLFKVRYEYNGADRNYILELPVKRAKYDYSEGTMKGDLLLAKNVYDESYSMRLKEKEEPTTRRDPSKIDKFREYLGIGSCGGYVFLKYFDDVDCRVENYQYPRLSDGTISRTGTIDATISKETQTVPEARTYQKVEQIRSVNRYIATTKHKANLFSININNLESALDLAPETRSDTALRESIKTDIDNSIRNLVKSFAPAHTQYYKTFFEDSKTDNGC